MKKDNFTVVYANTIDYNFVLQQRPHHLMNKLAERGHQVYWVNKTQIENKRPDKYEIGKGSLKVYHNWEVFKKRNKRNVDVLICSWSQRHTDVEDLQPKITIFDNVDNFRDWESTDDIMCRKADIILTTSKLLYEEKLKKYSQTTYKPVKQVLMCANGCHPDLLETSIPEPEDLKDIPHPRVLFSGAMAYWCNIALIDRISKKYNLIFVGTPWGIESEGGVPKNVINLGSKSYKDLQAYYAHCDVNLLPFKRCEIADYSNPIKMYEASVFGKQTISSNIPDARGNGEAVLTSINDDEFMKNIELALKEVDEPSIIAECFQFANKNSWNNRVDVIEKAVEDFINVRQ